MNQARWCALGVVLGICFAGAFGFVRQNVDKSAIESEDHIPKPEAAQNVRTALVAQPRTPADDGKLRIIAFGAHPDDCEIKTGGAGAMWSAKGHHVQFVACTNGD